MTHILQRRDTAENWTYTNPVLQGGEVGWETDTHKAKFGDGATAWNDLLYIPGIGGAGGGGGGGDMLAANNLSELTNKATARTNLGLGSAAVRAATDFDAAGAASAAQASAASYTDTQVAARVPLSIVDAKGDLLVGSADNVLARLGVGSDGQVLTADAASALGVKWASVVGGSSGVLLLDFTTNPSAAVPSGTPVKTLIFMKSGTPAATTWDFRGLSALPSGWARRGVASETFDAAGMSASYLAGQNHYYNLPAADNGTFEAKMVSGSSTGIMQGPIAYSGTEGASSVGYNAPTGHLLAKVGSTWQYASTYSNMGGTPAFPRWFRVRMPSAGGGSGTAYGSWSADGVAWSAEFTLAMTIASIATLALGQIFGSTATAAKWEYAKWSPAPRAGGLLGWWDGTQIVSFA